jgi:hypothetical protein
MKRKPTYAVLSAMIGTVLALLPTTASANGQTMVGVSGSSAYDCYFADGWYEYLKVGSAGGYPMYDTETVIDVGPWESCSWIDDGILQYSGKEYRSGSWRTIQWKRAPQDAWDNYTVNLSNVRDIRFKVCNVQNGVVGGCGPVS